MKHSIKIIGLSLALLFSTTACANHDRAAFHYSDHSSGNLSFSITYSQGYRHRNNPHYNRHHRNYNRGHHHHNRSHYYYRSETWVYHNMPRTFTRSYYRGRSCFRQVATRRHGNTYVVRYYRRYDCR